MSDPPPKRARRKRFQGSYEEVALPIESHHEHAESTSPNPNSIQNNIESAEELAHIVPVRQYGDQVPEFRLGLDFGTTTTTTGFSDLQYPDKVYTVARFPSDYMPKIERPYVPSEVAYPTNKSYVLDDGETTAVYNNKVCPGYIHGYEVDAILGTTYDDQTSKDYTRISCLKTLLDVSESTADMRKRQLEKLNLLGKSIDEVISDFLTVVFLHTKHEMEVRGNRYHSESPVEVAFTVPISWPAPVNDTMRQCVSEAMQRAKFGIPSDGTLPKLFMVHEAEAAATSVLRGGHSPSRGDTFVMLDCGGGTVDAGTFTIANENPLRLETQVTDPQGDACGANLLNELFFQKIHTDLKQETQLERLGYNIKAILDAEVMHDFEVRVKPAFDYELPRNFRLNINALRDPHAYGNSQSGPKRYTLTHDDMLDIFNPVLERTSKVMREQIMGAKKKNITVDKVVVVGGFTNSSALRYYLMKEVRKLNHKHNMSVELIFSPDKDGAPGVAIGAIHRANNKEFGPKRIPMLSYGVLRHIPFEEHVIETDPEMAHLKDVEPTVVGNEKYWADLVEYLIKKGDEPLESVYSSSFTNLYKISINSDEEWIQKEAIYASDRTCKSFFELDAPENESAKLIGELTLDLRPFKSRATIKDEHYELEVEVEMKVIDRDMSFEIFLAGKNCERIPGGYAKLSIVAGFQPGTE